MNKLRREIDKSNLMEPLAEVAMPELRGEILRMAKILSELEKTTVIKDYSSVNEASENTALVSSHYSTA